MVMQTSTGILYASIAQDPINNNDMLENIQQKTARDAWVSPVQNFKVDAKHLDYTYQNICMGFVKSSIFRWSTLKVFKKWVKPLKIKNYALNKSNICLISFLKP